MLSAGLGFHGVKSYNAEKSAFSAILGHRFSAFIAKNDIIQAVDPFPFVLPQKIGVSIHREIPALIMMPEYDSRDQAD